ncbi:MAG: phospholipase [Geminicoccaceae bacterium]|nr:MAG: phospholipase [Geminicoccaceae bacterium]
MRPLKGPRVPPKRGTAPRQLVVLLHGVGADGEDLIGLAPMLQTYLPDALFVAPNAPERCDMAPVGYQWFSLSDRRPTALLAGVQRTAPDVDGFLDAELAALGLRPKDAALVGFSQGTMTSLYVAPRRAAPLGAVVGFSGALIGAELLEKDLRSRPPVLLVHGEADDVVPAQALFAAKEGLELAGLPVQWQLRPRLGHGIDPDGIDHAGRFLRAAFQTA